MWICVWIYKAKSHPLWRNQAWENDMAEDRGGSSCPLGASGCVCVCVSASSDIQTWSSLSVIPLYVMIIAE